VPRFVSGFVGGGVEEAGVDATAEGSLAFLLNSSALEL